MLLTVVFTLPLAAGTAEKAYADSSDIKPLSTYTIDLSTVSSGGTGYTWNPSMNVITFTTAANGNAYTLLQTGRQKVFGIVVESDVDTTVTMKNISLSTTTLPCISLRDTAKLTLSLEGTNVLESSGYKDAGIEVMQNASLIIRGTGSLSVSGGSSAAGIGGSGSRYTGDVKITEGTVLATGGNSAAGIGSGWGDQGGGFVTITGGIVTAIGGEGGGAGIGGTAKSTGPPVTITGGVVMAYGDSGGAGIGGGYEGRGSDITIIGGIITATGGAVLPSGYGRGYGGAGIGGGSGNEAIGGDCGSVTISGGTVTVTGGYGGAGIGEGSSGINGDVTISGGIVTATGGYGGAGIGAGDGERSGYAAITTIEGGAVTAVGGYGAAGIGGGNRSRYDAVTIEGGVVTATGGDNAAGVGGGNSGQPPDVSIIDGTVTATGGFNGPGIGVGYYAGNNNCVIAISGGTVTAVGGDLGSGICGNYFTSVFIAAAAEVYAFARYSDNPAINVPSGNFGTGHLVTGHLTSVDYERTFTFHAGIATTPAGQFTLPTGYASFAYTTGTTEQRVDRIFAYRTSDVSYLGRAERVSDSSPDITSTKDAVSVALRLNSSIAEPGGSLPIDPTPNPPGQTTYTVTFNANGGIVSPAVVNVVPDSAIGALPNPKRAGYTFDGWYTTATGGIKVIAETKVTRDVTWYAHWVAKPTYTIDITDDPNDHAGRADYIWAKGTNVIRFTPDANDNAYTLVRSGGLNALGIVLESGVDTTITLKNLILEQPQDLIYEIILPCIKLEGNARLTLVLEGVNKLASHEGAGINVASGATLDIRGSGKLTATGGADSAGIGGYKGASGAITIESGTITAQGGSNGAGIGGGKSGNGGIITINDGTVSATGGANGAGIGGGSGGSGGNIIINGGAVTAAGGGASIGSGASAGIGGGSGGSGGIITITKGTVTATGTSEGAGIGGGSGGSGGDIVISGGTVTAKSSWGGIWGILGITGGSAGIGGGEGGSGGNITITNGTVTVEVTSGGGSGIGGGNKGSGGNITITDGMVTVSGGTNGGTGIGGGFEGSVGTIAISGGTIDAKSGANGAGIGSSRGNTGGNISINGGMITALAQSNGAGIGTGSDGSGGANTAIIINDGIVTATSNGNGAGIGGGSGGSGNVVINDGTVTATSKGDGTGIGDGAGANGGEITINNGTVIASSNGSAGIGGGKNEAGGAQTTVSIALEADVIALSKKYGGNENVRAINTRNGNEGTGYYVLAYLNEIVDYSRTLTAHADKGNLATREVVLPANYASFAYTTGRASRQTDYIFVYDNNKNYKGQLELVLTLSLDINSTKGAGPVSLQLNTNVTKPVDTYKVTFNANGGTVSPESVMIAKGGALGTLPTPTFTGYTFLGWYTAASGGAKISSATKVTANVSYYAQWQKDNTGGGTGGEVVPASRITTGDIVYFGHYPQGRSDTQTAGEERVYVDSTGGYDANGNLTDGSMWDGYYDVQPIAWKVLENADGELFLLAKDAIDCKPYHAEGESVTWDTSTARSWLNGYGASENLGTNGWRDGNEGVDFTASDKNFLGVAFTAEEQGFIAQTDVDNTNKPPYDIDGMDSGNATRDRVFYLSIDEATTAKYGFDTDPYAYSPANARNGKATDYTKANGARYYNSSDEAYCGNAYWWLRSSGWLDYYAAFVYNDGFIIDDYGYAGSSHRGIAARPALFLTNLESLIFTSIAADGYTATTNSERVAVTNISGVPAAATAGTPLTLTGAVAPSNATNKTITWSVKNAKATGATISGSTFKATAAGTATVTATIVNGASASANYKQDFTITVAAAPPGPGNNNGGGQQTETPSTPGGGGGGISSGGGGVSYGGGGGGGAGVAPAAASSPKAEKSEAKPATPKKLATLTATAGKKQIKITWKKSATKGLSGYEVQYRIVGQEWVTKKLGANATSLTIKKLKPGKSYEVRVRAYTKSGGKTAYGAWSKTIKSGKVKR
jgi:uncharacterized repeat protein (TIGR02543 family)